MNHNQNTGNYGEALALQFLKEKGYHILEQNWRYKRAEVDIIAENAQFLVIVEVKARTSEKYGLPEDAVGKKKQEQLAQAAEAYLEENNITKEVRFDVISISMKPSPPQILHIIDAFFPYQE